MLQGLDYFGFSEGRRRSFHDMHLTASCVPTSSVISLPMLVGDWLFARAHLVIYAANLHTNVHMKAVPTSPPVVARSLQNSLLARSA